MSIESELQNWQSKLADAEQMRAEAMQRIAELEKQKADQASEELRDKTDSPSTLADDLFG